MSKSSIPVSIDKDTLPADGKTMDHISVVALGEEGVEAFIRDIEPFFYRKNINYVDVGAFEGKVFAKMLSSRLAIGEAHLIEPNPETFAVLKREAESIFNKRSLNLYNVAIGEKNKCVTMKAARTMTRVIENGPSEDLVNQENSNTFTVSCLTLDEIAKSFTNGRISILKIDVEGYEAQALSGASKLLSEQRVDVVYIEAGGDPNGTQQTYYRIIDDIMLKHGYRLFRIYEQMHEWMEDAPFLRRMNLAYFSSKFAESHPYRLTRELFALQEKYKSQKKRYVDIRKELQHTREQLQRTREELKGARQELVALKRTTSWRITAPLRKVVDIWRRAMSRSGHGSN